MKTSYVAVSAALVLALYGAGCASAEMIGAGIAARKGESWKAIKLLKEEVANHPGNGEAWLLLGDMYAGLWMEREMTAAYDSAMIATEPAPTPEQREWIRRMSDNFRSNMWYLENRNLVRPRGFE